MVILIRNYNELDVVLAPLFSLKFPSFIIHNRLGTNLKCLCSFAATVARAESIFAACSFTAAVVIILPAAIFSTKVLKFIDLASHLRRELIIIAGGFPLAEAFIAPSGSFALV